MRTTTFGSLIFAPEFCLCSLAAKGLLMIWLSARIEDAEQGYDQWQGWVPLQYLSNLTHEHSKRRIVRLLGELASYGLIELSGSTAQISAQTLERIIVERAAIRLDRMAKAQARGTHTDAEWQALLVAYEFRCVCCGRSDRPLTRDHIIPVSRGGSDAIENIQPLCQPCNSGKRTEITDYRR